MITACPETERELKVASTGLPGEFERELLQVFKLLADETRLRILLYLVREGELHVTAMCERLQQSQPAVSHHLALLRDSGLADVRRDGKHNFYSVKSGRFHQIIAELFTNLTDEIGDSIRFSNYVLRHEQLLPAEA